MSGTRALGADKARKVLLVLSDYRAHKVRLGRKEKEVLKAPREIKVLQAQLVPREIRGLVVLSGHKVSWAKVAYRGLPASKEP